MGSGAASSLGQAPGVPVVPASGLPAPFLPVLVTPSPPYTLLGDTCGSWIQPQDPWGGFFPRIECPNAMPQFLQRPGFWASCVPGDLELTCLLDSSPECSLPAKHFAKWHFRTIYSTLPEGWELRSHFIGEAVWLMAFPILTHGILSRAHLTAGA